MKSIELEVKPRQEIGKGACRKLRRQGQIPAVLYGASKKNFNIQTQTKFITQILTQHNDNAILTLKCSDKGVNGKHVLIKDWERDIMTRQPLHIDLYEIDMTKAVEVKVPLHFVGKAKGISEGGIVSPIIREITVECLPTAIPEFIEVDVSALGVGDSIHIEELTVPTGVTKKFTDNSTIVTCTFIKEEVAAPVTTDAAATTAEPEVIAKGKKDEEGAEGAKAGAGGAKAAAPAAAKAAAPAKK